MLETLLPEYAKQLLENYQNIYSQLASQLRWLHFDDMSRLVTRVGWLDDGWIRVRVDAGSALDINLLEVLRELSWVFYSIAETNRLLTRFARVSEASSVSIGAGATYTFLSLSGTGMLQELLIVASQSTFRVDVIVDGATIWSKSYSDASNLTDVVPTMSAFQREDGKYIYFLSLVPFRSSIRVDIVNLDTSSPMTADYLYAKYEVV